MKKNSRVSILGAGWLGFPLAVHLKNIGFSVKCSTRHHIDNDYFKSIGCDHFVVDIDDIEANISDFLNSDILIVSIPSKNIDGFFSLVSKISQSSVKNVLFVSSTSVYISVNKEIKESDVEYHSESPLLDIENIFSTSESFSTTITRFAGLIGPGRNPGRFFAGGKKLSNPNSYINLIHLNDCIGIIDRIIERDIWGEIFNCCANTHTTRKEFYTHCALQLGIDPPETDSSIDGSGKIIRNDKVKMKLDYKFQFSDLLSIDFSSL